MNRPSARFAAGDAPPTAHTPQPQLFDAEPYLRRVHERRQANAKLADNVVALARNNPRREFYSVEIAELFGCHVHEAQLCLRRLQVKGALTSRHEPVTHSGNGRRYYKLRGVP